MSELCSQNARQDIKTDMHCDKLMALYERMGRPAIQSFASLGMATPFVVKGTSMVIHSAEKFSRESLGELTFSNVH